MVWSNKAQNSKHLAVHMPNLCKVCTSQLREKIDLTLLAGETVAAVQRAFPEFTDSAIRRHYRNHVTATIVTHLTNSSIPNAADITQRLIKLADDVALVRNRAVAQNDGGATLRAAKVESGILTELIGTLGIDSTDLQTYLEDAQILARSVFKATRNHPELAELISAELYEAGAIQMASAFTDSKELE